ncbi:thioredoxin family protein [bacterium]|nr:MAG: thioredoxin family protein [bacterium]
MKKNTVSFLFAFLLLAGNLLAQGYKVGDKARDFSLKNVDGKYVSLKNYGDDVNGFIVTFTCNHCPYSKAYEDRIIALDKKFASLGYPVIAINPNDPTDYPEDSFDNMITRAKEKKFTFPYLVDETQEIARTYGATRTPHMYVLQKTSGGLEVVYIGAIDDNTENADAAKNKYVEAAINALIKGQKPAVNFTKAIGCTIKWKKS